MPPAIDRIGKVRVNTVMQHDHTSVSGTMRSLIGPRLLVRSLTPMIRATLVHK
jgi:hypothetical protein